MDLISIIIPVYNVKDYIEKCIYSLLNQTYQNMEIIIIDDGSTDGSGDICEKLSMVYDNIKYIRKENGGVSSARNCGLKVAQGDYIGFVDADDWVDCKMYESMLSFMKVWNADICVTSSYYYNNDPHEEYVCEEVVITKEDAINLLISFRFPTSLCLSLYNKKVIENNFFNEHINYWEDYEYQFRALYNSKVVVINSDKFYHIRTREGSATRKPVNIHNCSCLLIPDIISGYICQDKRCRSKINAFLYAKFLMDLIVGYCERGADHKDVVNIIKKEARHVWVTILITSNISIKCKLGILVSAIHPNAFKILYRYYLISKKRKDK